MLGSRLIKAKNEPVILQGSTLARIEATDLGTDDGEEAALSRLWLALARLECCIFQGNRSF